MTSPLSILECPPPSVTPLSVIILAAFAHRSTAEPLQRVMQKVGLADVALQTVHLLMLWPVPLVVTVRLCPPRHGGLATIMGVIFATLAFARPILALLASALDATESRSGCSSLWLAV